LQHAHEHCILIQIQRYCRGSYGKDLRALPLIERKAMLKKLLRRKLTDPLSRSRRRWRTITVWPNRQDGPGRYRLQAEGFTLQSDGEAVAVLDKGQEFSV